MIPRFVVLSAVAAVTLLLAIAAAPDTTETTPSAIERVVVKFVDPARVRLRSAGLTSLAGADLAPLHLVLSDFEYPQTRRAFFRPEAAIERDRIRAERRSGRSLPDLNSYFEFRVRVDEAPRLIDALVSLPVVQTSYRALRSGRSARSARATAARSRSSESPARATWWRTWRSSETRPPRRTSWRFTPI